MRTSTTARPEHSPFVSFASLIKESSQAIAAAVEQATDAVPEDDTPPGLGTDLIAELSG